MILFDDSCSLACCLEDIFDSFDSLIGGQICLTKLYQKKKFRTIGESDGYLLCVNEKVMLWIVDHTEKSSCWIMQ